MIDTYPLRYLPRYFPGTVELWVQADLNTKEREAAAAFLRSFAWPDDYLSQHWWYPQRLGTTLACGLVFRRISNRSCRFAVMRASALEVTSQEANPYVNVVTEVRVAQYLTLAVGDLSAAEPQSSRTRPCTTSSR